LSTSIVLHVFPLVTMVQGDSPSSCEHPSSSHDTAHLLTDVRLCPSPIIGDAGTSRPLMPLRSSAGTPQHHQSPSYLFFWLAIAGPASPNWGDSDDPQPWFFLFFCSSDQCSPHWIATSDFQGWLPPQSAVSKGGCPLPRVARTTSKGA
jgi:hypothetical protein